MKLDPRVCNRARLARDARFDGRFYIAVVSTGIYCRPICPSPTARRRNVRFYRSGEEAVAAGFRPCLRCRPDTLPGTPAWRGTSTTVGRALRLIEEGALVEEKIGDLSSRLGVSARHLDRLFQVHLGASPIAVARTWRLNFARQLLRDTDLPMFRVAIASGFRTVRRFNDAIRNFYRRTPSQLRRQRPDGPRSGPDEYVFRLPYRAPYDWESLLAFFAERAIPGVEEVTAGAYRRTFSQRGHHGVLEVRKTDGALEARVRFPEPVSLLPIVTRLRGMFDLAADTASIARHFRGDPLLGDLVRIYPGLRVPGAWDPFEVSVRAILGQGVTPAAERALSAGLAGDLGEHLSTSDSGGLTTVFPSPATLARVPPEDLPPGRSGAIRELARADADGLFSGDLSREESMDRLARIRGVGAWTAEYIALRAFGQPDAFPADDLLLLRAAGTGGRRTAAALETLAERWRPWRAYAAVYLWRGAADAAPPARTAKPRGTAPPAPGRRALSAR